MPETLWNRYLALVVAPPSTPLPATMLALLWGDAGPAEAEATASALAQYGVLRVAHLEDGSTWTLLQPEHVAKLQVRAQGECAWLAAVWDHSCAGSVLFCMHAASLPQLPNMQA